MKTLKSIFLLQLLGLCGLASEAEARFGRPMSPLSFAGAARRTVRRCAYGMYYCRWVTHEKQSARIGG